SQLKSSNLNKFRLPKLQDWTQYTNIISEHVDLEGSTWCLGLISDLNMMAFQQSLKELASHCEHRNIFFEAAFLSQSRKWIARREVQGLFLAERLPHGMELRFFVPVTIERTGKIGPKFFRVWSSEYTPLGQPLVDERDVERIVEELFKAFDQMPVSVAHGLLINSLPQNTRFYAALKSAGEDRGRLQFFNRFERAALRPVGNKRYDMVHLSGRRRQKLRVALSRLIDMGSVSVEEATDVQDIEIAMLDFLYLEERGWKGRRKTALANNNSTRQFAMDMIRDLGIANDCRIFSMKLDGNVIASMIVLGSAGEFVTWKIAFDEHYAQQSVGNLLLVDVNNRLTSEPDFAFLDSVAIPGNETANRFWPDRLRVCSVALGFAKSSPQMPLYIARNLSLYGIIKRKLRKWFKG
nr:GNAT family N-acetyltransferase [Rhizobiaceae bacterium]